MPWINLTLRRGAFTGFDFAPSALKNFRIGCAFGTKHVRSRFGASSLYRKAPRHHGLHPEITTLPTRTPVGSFPGSLRALRQSAALPTAFFDAYR
jgi:hypothetical protein